MSQFINEHFNTAFNYKTFKSYGAIFENKVCLRVVFLVMARLLLSHYTDQQCQSVSQLHAFNLSLPNMWLHAYVISWKTRLKNSVLEQY